MSNLFEKEREVRTSLEAKFFLKPEPPGNAWSDRSLSSKQLDHFNKIKSGDNEFTKFKNAILLSAKSTSNEPTDIHQLAKANIQALEEKVHEDEQSILIYEKLKKKTQKIEKEIFNWIIDGNHISSMQTIFAIPIALLKIPHLNILDVSLLQKFLPIEFFTTFLSLPPPGFATADPRYHMVTSFLSTVLQSLRILYLDLPLAMRSQFDAVDISVTEPYIRKKIRSENSNFYSENIEKKFNFNLLQTIYGIIEQFVINGNTKIYLPADEPLFSTALNLLSTAFSRGLVLLKDCDRISTLLFMIADHLAAMEKSEIESPKEILEDRLLVVKYFLQARLHVAEICLHLLALKADENYRMEYKDLAKFPTFEPGTLTDNVSLVYAKYLSILDEQINDLEIPKDLEMLTQTIFVYLTNSVRDYILESTRWTSVTCLLARKEFPKQKDLSELYAKLDSCIFNFQGQTTNKVNPIDALSNFCHSVEAFIDRNKNLTILVGDSNIPFIIIQLLDFCTESNGDGRNVVEILNIVEILCQKNPTAISRLFQGITYAYICSLMNKMPLLLTTFLYNLLSKKPKILRDSNKIFNFTIEIYKTQLKEIQGSLIVDSNPSKVKISCFCVLLLTELFEHLLKTDCGNSLAPHSHQLVLASETIDFFVNTGSKIIDDLSIPVEILTSPQISFEQTDLVNYADSKRQLMKCDGKLLTFEMAFRLLILLNISTEKVYSGDVLAKITDQAGISITESNRNGVQSVMIQSEYLKLFTRFYLMCQNRIYCRRAIAQPDSILETNESFLPDHPRVVFDRLKDEFNFLISIAREPESDRYLTYLQKYLLEALLPACISFLSGIKFGITIDEGDTFVNELVNYSAELKNMFEDSQALIEEILKRGLNKGSATHIPGNDQSIINRSAFDAQETDRILFSLRSRVFGSQAVNEEVNLQSNSVQKLNDQTSAECAIDYQNDISEERINPSIMKLREITGVCLEKLREWFQTSPDCDNTINHFRRYIFKEKRQEEVDKDDEFYDLVLDEIGTRYCSEFQCLSALQKAYIKHKKSFLAIPHEHPLIKLLLKGSQSHLFNFNLSRMCVKMISTLKSEIFNPSQDPHINQNYILTIIALTKILNASERFRIDILNALKQTNMALFFDGLLTLFYEFLFFVFYKPFMDDTWDSAWKKLKIVSRFLTTLFENNFVEFKKLLAEQKSCKLACDQNNTILTEYYFLVKSLIRKSRVWKNTSDVLMPSDRPELFPIYIHLVKSLHELVSGTCLSNQMILYSCDPLLWMGLLGRTVDDVNSTFYHLQYAVIVYLSAFIDSLNPQILSYFATHLQVQTLFTQMNTLVCKLFKSPKDDKNSPSKISSYQSNDNAFTIKSPESLMKVYALNDGFSEHVLLQIAVQIYILIESMASKVLFWGVFVGHQEKNAKKWASNMNDRNRSIIFSFLLEIIQSIEVRINSDTQSSNSVILRRIYFRVPPSTLYISQLLKFAFYQKMPIESTAAKQLYIYSQIPKFHRSIAMMKEIYRKNGFFGWFISREAFYMDQYLLIGVALVLNGFMFVYFIGDLHQDTLDPKNEQGRLEIAVCALILIIYSFMRLCLWIYYRLSHEIETLREKYINKSLKVPSNIVLKAKALFHLLFMDLESAPFTFYIIQSTLGLTYSSFYYTFNLALLGVVSQPLLYIYRSIIKNYDKVLVTFLLLMLLVYSYAVLLAKNFYPGISNEVGGPANCRTLFGCFWNSLNTGLRPGGGLGEVMEFNSHPSNHLFIGTFLLEVSYLVIVKLILLNIVAGIIIETFGELRDEATQRSNNMYNYCIICGLSKWDIEKHEIMFESHIKNGHNMWRYFSYLIRLLEMDKSSLIGIDLQIWNQYIRGSTDWFPKNEMLENGEADQPASTVSKGSDELSKKAPSRGENFMNPKWMLTRKF